MAFSPVSDADVASVTWASSACAWVRRKQSTTPDTPMATGFSCAVEPTSPWPSTDSPVTAVGHRSSSRRMPCAVPAPAPSSVRRALDIRLASVSVSEPPVTGDDSTASSM